MKDNKVRLLATIVLPVVFFTLYLGASSIAQDVGIFDSPLPIPPGPTATPLPSSEAQIALHYIAEQYGIPIEQLAIVNEHRREYVELGRAFQAFTLLSLADDRFFNLLVDLEDHTVVEDVSAIQRAEEEAYRDKYGKLEPALHERLQQAADDELVEVAIWIAGRPHRSQREMFDELSARFPEAASALARSGKPFDVQDDEVRDRIWTAYLEMVASNTEPLVQPVVDFLQAQGYAMTVYDGLPSVTAVLPKRLILALAERPDVGQIYLIEGEGHLLLDSAVPGDRVPAVWQRGIDGSGSSVAVLETDNVDFWSISPDCPPGTFNCLRYLGQTRPGFLGVWHHATLAASIIASDHPTHKGMAPDATVHSAGMDADTEAAAVQALQWALGFNPGVAADVVNVSWGKGVKRDMRWSDRSFDYWARNHNRMIVAAAGNTPECTTYLCSPAKGWNVMSVGAYNDVNNANWSDDTMADFSSYINPSGDREKPEVVAPGIQITGIGQNGGLITLDGTSFAAPQVAGLAALLIDRHTSLLTWPEASRAIIMASAVHNIEGPSGIPTGQELKDGAGGIDAALADVTAKTQWTSPTSPCTDPCWWGIYHDNTAFPVGTYQYRYFKASRGERIRTAIWWWSHADCPDQAHCSYDRLDTDFQLGVLDPDGQWVPGAWSASWDNNYELVDFTAPKTGQYKIAVYKERDDEDEDDLDDYFGLAWVKDATYLPDVRGNYGGTSGWTSRLNVRNDGPLAQTVTVTFYGLDGQVKGSTPPTNLASRATWRFNAGNVVPVGFIGSAIVDGGAGLSVEVDQFYGGSNPSRAGAYRGFSTGSPAVYLPILHKDNGSPPRFTQSEFLVQNLGGSATSVTVHYVPEPGSGNECTATLTNLQPGASRRVDLRTNPGCSLGTRFVGGATLSSSNGMPLAAVVNQWIEQNSIPQNVAAYEGLPAIPNPGYLPEVLRNVGGANAGIVLQNPHATAQNLTVQYWGAYSGTDTRTVSSHRVQVLYPAPSDQAVPAPPATVVASARATTADGMPAVVNLLYGSDQLASYSAQGGGSTTAIVPRVMRDFSWLGVVWDTGLIIHNVAGSGDAQVQVRYFDNGGAPVGGPFPYTIGANQAMVIYPVPMGSGFVGSAEIDSSNGKPLLVLVNHQNTSAGGDMLMSYVAVQP
jgi:hypothetical protein